MQFFQRLLNGWPSHLYGSEARGGTGGGLDLCRDPPVTPPTVIRALLEYGMQRAGEGAHGDTGGGLCSARHRGNF